MANVPDPTVFVIDDERTVRESIRWLVESVGLNVETFASAREFIDSHDRARPGCIVLDLRMPAMGGVEAQETFRAREINLPVIVITGYADVSTAVRVLKQGAVDFIQKPFSDQLLLDRIHECIKRNAEERRNHAARAEVSTRLARLSPREDEVLRLVVTGDANKTVARKLGISPKTVEVHRANLMRKTQAKSLAELVQMVLASETHRGYP